MNMSKLHCDHFSAQPLSEKGQECLLRTVQSLWASPWSLHEVGQRAAICVKEYIESVRTSLEIDQEQKVLLTHSGAEATAALLHGFSRLEAPTTGKNHIIAVSSDRLPILQGLDAASRYESVDVSFVSVGPRGYVEKDALERIITPKTGLVLLPSVDLCSGVIQPIDELGAVLKKRSIRFAVDVTYSLGAFYSSLGGFSCDDIVFDARMLGMPLGVGLLVSRHRPVLPYVSGDIGSSETTLRWAMLACLLNEMQEKFLALRMEQARLKEMFERMLKEACCDIQILYSEEERLSSCSTVIFPRVKNEALLFLLHRKNLFASMGGGDMQTLSSQLIERKFPSELAQGALRFSFGDALTQQDISLAVPMIQAAYEKLVQTSFFCFVKE